MDTSCQKFSRTVCFLISFLFFFQQHSPAQRNTNLPNAFRDPTDSIQTSIYWYWISDNISKEGVVKDLQAMKQAGITRAFIGNVALPEVPTGKVKIFSEEWWAILHVALKTATDLHIQIGIFNSPGWSQSGGPWVKAEQSMRYLHAVDTLVKGPVLFKGRIVADKPNFQDVKLIAFRAPRAYGESIANLRPKIIAGKAVKNAGAVMDGDSSTFVSLSPREETQIEITVEKEYAAKSLVIFPASRKMKFDVALEAVSGMGYREVSRFTVDRSNVQLNVGFEPFAPVAISFPEISSKQFRLKFLNATAGSAVAEVQLSSAPRMERFAEKTLAKMFPTPLPYWKEYQWAAQPVVQQSDELIRASDVKDISSSLNRDGVITWQVPPGNWVIQRTGMVSTMVTNTPAPKEGTGLEADKMSRKHIRSHFDAFLGEIIRRIPAADRKTWKVVVEDSYETGGQNFTDGLMDEFRKKYGYSMLPYLPVMQGLVVESADKSDRFLWDLRRLIADKVAYDYVAGLREVSHENGLTTWLENYGHWGFPGEFLQYGGQSDEIGGEFWSEGELGNIENKAASSSAHIYGKNLVSAESFTCGGGAFSRYPAMMKLRGDRFFTEGINNTLMHVCITQPDEERVPGINAGFGNEFNRKNTWYPQLGNFVKYLKRCNLMLQQGKYVADVAYFIGEDAPKMTGVRDPELPKGFSYDYINAEVIHQRLTVKNGRLSLPDGLSYQVLVLPQLKTMRPELLSRLKELIQQGAIVLGPPPSVSPSLQNFPAADVKLKALVKELWGNADGQTKQVRKIGRGQLFTGMSLEEVFQTLGTCPDFETRAADPLLFIHRSMPDKEIYFISNQSDQNTSTTASFRVTGMKPFLWDATNGRIRELPEFTDNGKTTGVPLHFEAQESGFIIFEKQSAERKSGNAKNFPQATLLPVSFTAWNLQLQNSMLKESREMTTDTLFDWSTHALPAVKNFSGTGVYKTTFTITEMPAGEIMLDLGNVIAMANIKLNGKELGGLWTPPYRLGITEALRKGPNELEITVANTWVNRIIGETALPVADRKIWLNVNPYKPESKLQSSGLLGPVKLLSFPN